MTDPRTVFERFFERQPALRSFFERSGIYNRQIISPPKYEPTQPVVSYNVPFKPTRLPALGSNVGPPLTSIPTQQIGDISSHSYDRYQEMLSELDKRPVLDQSYSYSTGVPKKLTQTPYGSMQQAIEESERYDTDAPINIFERQKEILGWQATYKSHKKWLKTKIQEMKEKKEQQRFTEKHLVGYDPITGKPIMELMSPHLIKFGFKPKDPDFREQIDKLDVNIEKFETNIPEMEKIITESKEMLPSAKETFKSLQESPASSRFYVDADRDGNWDVAPDGSLKLQTREKLLGTYADDITTLESNIETGKNIPMYWKNLEAMKRTKGVLEGYRDLGYNLDVDPETGYNFFIPESTKVYDWYYGKEAHSVIPKVGAGWMEGFGIPAAAAAIQSGIDPSSGAWEAKQEQLAATGLDYAYDINIQKDSGKYWGKIATSDAMITIGTFAATAGIGAGLGAMGTKMAGTGARIAAKVGPTGQKIISGLGYMGRGAGKALGSKAGKYVFGATTIGVLEGPRLYAVATEHPEMFGSEIAKTGLAWGSAYAGFKTGSKWYAKTYVAKPKAGKIKTQYVHGDQRILLEPSSKPVTGGWKEVDFTTQVDDLIVKGYEGDKLIKTSKPFSVSSKGKALLATEDVYNVRFSDIDSLRDYVYGHGYSLDLGYYPKGTTIIKGTGVGRDPTLGIFTKKDLSKTFDMWGFGQEISKKTQHGMVWLKGSPEKVSHLYRSMNITTMRETGKTVKTIGGGLFESGHLGKVTIKTYPKGGLDLSKVISTDYSVKGGKYVYYGGFSPASKGYDYGKIMLHGDVAILESGAKPLSKSIRAVQSPWQQNIKGIVQAKQATGSLRLVQPATLSKAEEKILFHNISQAVSGGAGSSISMMPVTHVSLSSGVLSTGLKQVGYRTTPLLLSGGAIVLTKEKFDSKLDKKMRLGFDTSIKTGQKRVQLEKMEFGEIGAMTTRTDLDIGTKTKQEPIIDVISTTKLGSVQRTDLKMRQALKLKQATELDTTTISLFARAPITPMVTPPIPTPFKWPLLGKPTKTKPKKKKKVVKKKTKPKFIIEKMHKGLLADLGSVTRSHARFGTATHPKVTKKLWKLGAKSSYVKVPTLELMKAKKKTKKKKRGKKDVLYR